MKTLTDLEYLKLNKFRRFGHNFLSFFASLPSKFAKMFKAIGRFFKKLGLRIVKFFKTIWRTFVKGDWKTKLSYLVMGFGNAARGQILRGVVFFLFEVAFVVFMIYVGGPNLGKLGTLGTLKQGEMVVHDPVLNIDTIVTVEGDNSFKILLYGVLTIFFIVALIYTWYLNIKQNIVAEEILDVKKRKALASKRQDLVKTYIAENGKYVQDKQNKLTRDYKIREKYEAKLFELGEGREHKLERKKIRHLYSYELKLLNYDPSLAEQMVDIENQIINCGKPLKSGKQDAQSLVDDQFHKSLLALPTLGMVIFTVLPTFFMILIAFTCYDADHIPPELFTWIGFKNFGQILTWNNGSSTFSATFGEVLTWTLIWAFFATFTNYFLGMLVALAINKKGIKGKKVFRGILVLTIAIPQFISLLFISKMFATDGIINGLLLKWGWLSEPFDFMGHSALSARITVIMINIWVGIPYLMLMISGVLMNIPADLYESAKIDGASVWQQYTKITLPYALFVTGPYLLTSFTGNMNNFNVIYLLTGGGPNLTIAKSAGETDLLVTWLFKLTVDENNFAMASVIGILVFLVVAVISLVVYNTIPSMKNEEDFQ